MPARSGVASALVSLLVLSFAPNLAYADAGETEPAVKESRPIPVDGIGADKLSRMEIAAPESSSYRGVVFARTACHAGLRLTSL